MTPAILWLNDSKCQSPERVGNKGAYLARLVRAGYRVPEGFCITADILAEASSDTSVVDPWTFDVRTALSQLSAPWVVRSSSTAEDSKNLSFAGMFKTVIGLTSADRVIEAIRTVVASKKMGAPQRYAEHHGVDTANIQMGVIVQTLVNASCSGVAFSRHPVTNAHKVVIEANYGLGDILVDGSVSPDLIEVSDDGQVIVINIGTKKIKSVFISDELIRVDTPEVDRRRLALPQDEARNLAVLVRSIEEDFGEPQDVEWAISSGTFFVLQARPITTIRKGV